MSSQVIRMAALLWAGMILGISFLESWVKFRTPSLAREIGLDVGRTVFNFFHKAQLFLLITIIIAGIFAKLTLTNWLIVITLATTLILQLAWLFPILNQQVNDILAGRESSPSHIHSIYGIFEVMKFLILAYLGI